MKYRVLSTMSPELEQLMYANINDSLAFDSLRNTTAFFSNMKKSTIFTIPKSLINLLSSNLRFKILKEKYINDTQSNIIFDDDSHVDCCVHTAIPELFDGYEYAVNTTKYIIKNMYGRKLPLLFGSRTHSVAKNVCSYCNERVACSPKQVLKGHSPPTNYSTFHNLVLDAVGVSISHWHYNINAITEIDVKVLISLMCLFHQVPDKDFEIIKKIDISEPFLRDINRSKCEIDNIVFSLFRACAYPSSTGLKDRHQLSIDWHPNTPAKSGKYDLYRADVLTYSRSGVRSSGAERILIGKADGEYIALFYTDKHDFPKKSIDERVLEIQSANKK